jgi:hypothetical protein
VATLTPSATLVQNDAQEAAVNNVDLSALIFCGTVIVLTPHASTYSAEELAAIRNALGSIHEGISVFALGAVSSYALTNPPATLANMAYGQSCFGHFDVTNTGSSLIQLNQVGFQSTQAPARFSYTYRLIDACPYIDDCGPPGIGATSPCMYSSSMQLSLSHALSLSAIGVRPAEGPDSGSSADCPAPINLGGGQSVEIQMAFSGLPAGGGDIWFHGVPALNVTTAKGTATITYPTMTYNFIFTPLDAQGRPGTCYTQKGNTFVPATFQQVPDPSKDPSFPYDYPVCV